jgi:hypothetical protein
MLFTAKDIECEMQEICDCLDMVPREIADKMCLKMDRVFMLLKAVLEHYNGKAETRGRLAPITAEGGGTTWAFLPFDESGERYLVINPTQNVKD